MPPPGNRTVRRPSRTFCIQMVAERAPLSWLTLPPSMWCRTGGADTLVACGSWQSDHCLDRAGDHAWGAATGAPQADEVGPTVGTRRLASANLALQMC